MTGRPRRVRVTSPRMSATPRPPVIPPTRDLDEQTELGAVYLRSLMRTQLRLGLTVLGSALTVLAGLPLLFLLVPGLRRLELLGVSLPWLILGGLIYPALLAAAWWHVRLAERTERDFAALFERR